MFSIRKISFMAFCFLLCACVPSNHLAMIDDPNDIGLSWRECVIAFPNDRLIQSEYCYGHAPPAISESEKKNFGKRVVDQCLEDVRLKIGESVYYATAENCSLTDGYTLYQDGEPIYHIDYSETSANPPPQKNVGPANVTLQNVNGKVVWEFFGNRATIIYDGVDLARLYKLDNTYRPYAINDRLIFIGQTADRFFIVYDKYKVGPEFNEIIMMACCDFTPWSLYYGDNRYSFYGKRAEQWYIVEISGSSESQ